MTWYSEYGQDQWLEENVFKGKRDGVFVEAGALDGLLHSNTLFFERERGWRGLLVEANPSTCESVLQNRPKCRFINAALWDRFAMVDFHQISGGLYGWSGIVESMEEQSVYKIEANIPPNYRRVVQVPAIPLSKALDRANLTGADYLSLDVEGAELRVLSAFDFDKYEIDVIGVEDNYGNAELAELLKARGYEHLARVGVDEMWKRRVT